MYIVRDIEKQSELAVKSLQEARFHALDIQRGEVIQVRLNEKLSKAQLRCALFNRDNYGDRTVIATIEKGIARKLLALQSLQ